MKAQRRTIATYFFVLAIIGLLSAWYFNFLAVLGREDYLADGFTSNVDWVYSLDLLIGGIAGMTLIVIEGRRLGMKHLWAYIALGFVTAFAFVFPLFLGMRELRLRRIELAGGTAGPQVQGLSLLPLMEGSPEGGAPGGRPGWRSSIMCEYFSENAMPWLIGMSYKAVRTDRYKLIHWVNRGDDGELDELFDLERDPYEMKNLIDDPACAEIRRQLRAELARLVAASVGL
jgi:hypothetical protein